MNMIRRLFWRVFPPNEVAVTCSHIREFLLDRDPFLPPEVEKDAIGLARDAERTVNSIRFEGMKPDQLALILISNVVAEVLPLGRYHIHRGYLSSAGRAMHGVFLAAIAELRRRGYYSEDEVEEDRRWMLSQIKGAG